MVVHAWCVHMYTHTLKVHVDIHTYTCVNVGVQRQYNGAIDAYKKIYAKDGIAGKNVAAYYAVSSFRVLVVCSS